MSAQTPSSDRIRLTGLSAHGYHGVFPFERQEGQLFTVDLVMELEHERALTAAQSDSLDQTVDYSAVAKTVVGLIEGEPVNLVETLAEHISNAVLGFTGVQSVEVTVHKPQAPLDVAFDDVAVTITRTVATQLPELAPARAVPEETAVPAQPEVVDPLDQRPEQPLSFTLALGGNLGNVVSALRQAVSELEHTEGIEITDLAPLARTAAVLHEGQEAQPDYLNTVVLGLTRLSPRELLQVCQSLEEQAGRTREEHWGARTLDVDIITIGNLHSDDAELTLPHPRAAQRAFVLLPWAQADPAAQLAGRSVSELADDADDRRGVRWLALDWITSDKLPALPTGQYVTNPEPAAGEETGSGADTAGEEPAAAQDLDPEGEPPLKTGAMEQVELPAEPVEPPSAPASDPAPAPPAFSIPASAEDWAEPPSWEDVVPGDSHQESAH